MAAAVSRGTVELRCGVLTREDTLFPHHVGLIPPPDTQITDIVM